jgi:cation diffusion facilitator family transporter
MTNVQDRIRWIAISSIAVAIGVMGLKYLAYLKTGSVALYSDALESIVNVITAVVALAAIEVARRPADRHHQFGHHKAEYFSAVLEGVLIVVAALAVLHEAYGVLFNPRPLTAARDGLVINGFAALINAGWAAFLIRDGRRHRSPALIADGWHLVTDVVTSVGVIIGLLLAVATGWWLLDPALAALVAVNILWAGYRIMRQSISGLMDEAVTADVAREIRKLISQNASGALEAHDLKTRTAGRATFIEFHLVVPGSMTVAAAHEICDRLEDALKAAVPDAEILIHTEPEGEAQHRGVVVV